MRAQTVDVKSSTGRILCCTVFRPGGKKLLAKGHVISDEDIRVLESEGMETIWVTEPIDNDNNISAFATPEEAPAATATPFDSFASQQELADLAAQWSGERLLAVWNSLPGVTPVKKFTDRKTAISRVWARIQGLGEPVTQ